MNSPKTPSTPSKSSKLISKIPLIINKNDNQSLEQFLSSTNQNLGSCSGNAKNEKSRNSTSNNNIQTENSIYSQIQQYLHTASGQLTKPTITELEHNYAKSCLVHPDPQIRSNPAKFLFMKYFPRHLTKLSYQQSSDDEEIDVISYEEIKKVPFLTPKPVPVPVKVDEDTDEIDSSITDSWSPLQNRLWTRAQKILCSDRLEKLSFEGNANEVLLKRNRQEQTAKNFRELYASTNWEMKWVNWLHETLMEHLNPVFQSVYIESLQILKQKYSHFEKLVTGKNENKTKAATPNEIKNKPPTPNDPLFNTLSHYKPKKLIRKPIFIMVPTGPNQKNPDQQGPRLKYWCSLLSAMGKFVILNINAKRTDSISDVVNEIRYAVNDKIKSCRNSYSQRPVILIGFDWGSLIAAECALQNPGYVCAVICLGFPLKTFNGSRGELGDPLLELTCPIQFVIGENSITTSLDDIEDFRERMTRTETSLVVVGGADERLIIPYTKKRRECLTQSMVDRCVADEIYSFLYNILMRYVDPESMMSGDPKYMSISRKMQNKKPRKRNRSEFPFDHQSSSNQDQSEKPKPKRKRLSTKSKKFNEQISNKMDSSFAQVASPSPFTPLVPFHSSSSTNVDNNNSEKFSLVKIKNAKIIQMDQFKKIQVQRTIASDQITREQQINTLATLKSIQSFKSPKPCFSGTINYKMLSQNLRMNSSGEQEQPIKMDDEVQSSNSSTSNLQVLEASTSSSSTSDSTVTSGGHHHPGSTRTGRQIKPPKALDF